MARSPDASSAAPTGSSGGSFADGVEGRTPQPIDLTLARLMRDVYDYDGNGHPDGVGRWKPLGADELRASGIDPAMLRNTSSGFYAVIYGDEQGHRVLAYSGTDEAKDWTTNFGQGLGFETAQYNQAIALARQAKVAYGEDVVITGHSLGGGLAAAASIAADIPAVTYNAAGVHDRTLERIGLDADAVKAEAGKGLIRRYAVDHDILTGLQERTPILNHLMPDAVGHKIELPDTDPQSFWQKLNPVKSVKHGIDMHMIDAVIAAQEKVYGKDYDRSTTERTATLADPQHPGSALYRQALDRLPATEVSGANERLAGALAAEAHKAGLSQVDHVAFGDGGRRAFAVEGDPASPAHRQVNVDVLQAVRTPLSDSSAQALAAPQAADAGRAPVDVAPAREADAAPRAR